MQENVARGVRQAAVLIGREGLRYGVENEEDLDDDGVSEDGKCISCNFPFPSLPQGCTYDRRRPHVKEPNPGSICERNVCCRSL